LKLDFLQQNVERVQTLPVIASNELGLVVLVEKSEFEEESLGLALHMFDEVSSLLENELNEVQSKNELGVSDLGSCDSTQVDLSVQVN
jgi:hypothetical protein